MTRPLAYLSTFAALVFVGCLVIYPATPTTLEEAAKAWIERQLGEHK